LHRPNPPVSSAFEGKSDVISFFFNFKDFILVFLKFI